MIDFLRYAPWSFWRWTMFFGVGVASFTAVMMGLASARDAGGRYGNSPYAEWFKNQHNSQGQWCCDESDGHRYDGAYKLNDDGSVTVELDGKAHVLPKHMVLTGPNPTGYAVWWFSETGWGHTDYCFAPGTLS